MCDFSSFFFFNIYILLTELLLVKIQADDGTAKRNGNAEEWRENNGNNVSRI